MESIKRSTKPIKRARIKRSKKTRAKNRLIALLDADARQRVMERDLVCQRCGTIEDLQWSHIITRRILSLRWEECNSQMMCRGDHFWWGQNPGQAYLWFQGKWPERWEEIKRIMQANLQISVSRLREMVAELPR